MSTPLLKEFLNELELAKGKNSLFFVIQDGLSEWIEEKVEENGFNIFRIELNRKDRLRKLVDILLDFDGTENNTVYFVYGLMNQAPEILSYLNLHRDFLRDIKRPVVVLGSMYEMNIISDFAPDFWRFRSRTYNFSKKRKMEREKEREIQLEYAQSSPERSFMIREAPSLLSWDDEELKKRIDLDEHLLGVITDKHRRSEFYESLAMYYFTLDDFKKFNENLEKFRELRKNEKDFAAVYRRLGDICLFRKELGKAVEYYDRAIELNSENAAAFNNRGVTYSNLNQHEKAIQDYNKAIELNPENFAAFYNRGLAYSNLNQYEKAIQDYNKAIELNPEDVLAFNNRGNAYSDLNQYEKAIQDYNKAIELNPENFAAFNNRGLAYSDLNQYEKAIQDYNKAIELNPAYAASFFNRGNAYSDLNQYEKAIQDYNKAIELNPENFAAFNNRGLAYSDLNQYEKAIQDYNKAIELNPENFAAFYNRGLAYSDLNQYEKAIQDYNKAIELDPEYAAAFNNRGNRYSDLNQYEKAIQDYNKAIELDPEYAAAFYNRAISYSQMEYHKKAAKDFKTAGILFFKSKRVNDSIRAFSMCFDLREKIKHDDIIYCGLLLYLLTSDENIPTELKALNIPPEQLKNISACIKKLIIEDFKNIDIFQKEGTDKILEALEKLAKDHDQNL